MPVYEKGSVRAEPITKMRKDEEKYEEISLIAAGVDHDFESGHRSGTGGEHEQDSGSVVSRHECWKREPRKGILYF